MKLSLLPVAAVVILACSACGSDLPTSPVKTLQVIDTQVGTGATATGGKTLTVNYTGWLYSETAADHKGTMFDASNLHGAPLEFILGIGAVIEGWDQGLVGMKVGGKRTLIIPPDLAYGKVGAGGVIGPNQALVFDVELLKVQ